MAANARSFLLFLLTAKSYKRVEKHVHFYTQQPPQAGFAGKPD